MQPWLITQQLLLSQQILNDKLPHALLITGVSGSGKSALAKWLINLLSCQQPVKSLQNGTFEQALSEQAVLSQTHTANVLLSACQQCKHCQLQHSETYPDHKGIVASKATIGVDEIRTATRFLEKTAQLGLSKTVLVTRAEIMTISAANALLKTLEEPSDHSVIVLLTHEPDLLLPTIISRCQMISIRPFSGAALADSIQGTVSNKNPSSTNGSSASTNGFINLTQLPELSDDSIKKEFVSFQQNYIDFIFNNHSSQLVLKQLKDNEYSMRWLEKITVNFMRTEYVDGTLFLLDKSTLSALKEHFNHDRLWKTYQLILQCNKALKSYVQINRQYTLEKLLVDIKNI
jgi:DNA polymerase-3 subunit delta'